VWVSPVPVVATFLLAYPLWSWLRLATAVDFIHEQLAQLEFANQKLSYVHPEPPSVTRGADPVEDVLGQLDRAHNEARYNHELVRQTLEEMASGILLAEMSGNVLMANHEAMELLGLSAPVEDGSDVGVLLRQLTELGGETVEESMASLHSLGDGFSVECEAQQGNRSVLLQGSVIGLDRLLLVFVLTDISELKESEKKRAEALNFLSHDLRAPLTSVLALIESAREDAPAGEQPELLAQVESYVRTNLSYAEDFIQLAKMDHAATDNFDLCDSASLVDNAVSLVFHTATRRGIDVRIHYSDSTQWIHCDRHLIERALINLIDNALKHSADGGVIDVGVETADGWAVFSVSDRGAGVDEADLSRLFAAFEQGKDATGGVGLGLRFVSVVAANHGGTLEVENRAGAGCRFKLRVPASSDTPVD
ncbi:MAG: PAS domain-containing sensor histidine kinase, partial [Halioglobus sp.]|nr:PAS domain-containing sensor histidine kinase [Halioglobus sp.]